MHRVICWANPLTSGGHGQLLVGSLLSRIEENHAAYRKKLEAAALPGESIREIEERLRTEEKRGLHARICQRQGRQLQLKRRYLARVNTKGRLIPLYLRGTK